MTKRDAKLISYLQVNQFDPLSQQAKEKNQSRYQSMKKNQLTKFNTDSQ